MPTDGKLALVSMAFASAKPTPPGPETCDHAVVKAPGGFGSPSSATEPSRLAASVMSTARSGPAETAGGALPLVSGVTSNTKSLPSFSFGFVSLSTPRSAT